ncbi:glycosyltransferase family 4 protein [Brevibacterium yomogidense]|uniref:glycosyltransferase family 4 protein n=1 Tax=Brevibacterium yomogidense TaxID=946573 RepID=UPI0018DF63D4|nr:glycosyltransferase family 4 protein [Brevibacterium yomogidense]
MPRALVAWYLPVADTGGVLRHALDVAQAGMTRHRLVFIVPPGPAGDILRSSGVPVVVTDVGTEAGPLRAGRSLRRVVRTLRPAIVHSHLAFADVVLAATPLRRGVHRVTTEHGIAGAAGLYHPSRLRRATTPRVHAARLRRFSAAIAVSQSTADEMKRQWKAPTPLHVIHNGVDTHARHHRPGHRILSLSRLAPEKRIDRLLEAFAALHAEDPSWSLTVAGDGDMRNDLLRQAIDLGVETAVRFPGFVDASDALDTHDVLVQLSEWENCSYSLLDATARGLGTVATDVGGNREILPRHSLSDGSPADLITRIREQAEDVHVRPNLPDNWPSVTDMVERIEELYEGLRS